LEKRVVFEIEIERSEHSLVLKIPSSLSEVGAAINTAKDFFKHYEVSEILATQNTVVLRELLVNAIKHGHDNNTRLKVYVRIEHLKGKQFEMMIKDEGKGFDHAQLELSISENAREIRNRGFKLVESLTERHKFNKKGNCVTVTTRSRPI
jgi:anti-sigma regulatory factor (Ser/Thr protein kinase)